MSIHFTFFRILNYSFLSLVISILDLSCSSPDQVPAEFIDPGSHDPIAWNPLIKLQWTDYVGTPSADAQYPARTVCKVGHSFETNCGKKICRITALFLPQNSWAFGSRSDSLLQHEQGHFDIAEISARMLRSYVAAYNDSVDFNGYFNYGQDSIMQFTARMESDYDAETDHFNNRNAQKIWELKIDSMLNAYRKYDSTIVAY